MLHQHIEAMWWDKSRKPHVLLRVAARLYAALFTINQRQRLKHVVQPTIPLISVGNITVGGSGKTPFVVWLALKLQKVGLHPVLLSRGDGANNQEPHLVTPYSKAAEVGDEAVLLYQLSGCPVVTGRDRIAGAAVAAEHGDIIILDDGFQYRQLHRVCDIVLVATEGVGNGYALPAGALREPVSALRRADIVVRSGEHCSAMLEPVSQHKEWWWAAQGGQVRDWNHIVTSALPLNMPVQVVTAIARPKRVLRDVRNMGYSITKHHAFQDHYAYKAGDIQHFLGQYGEVLTTAKDAVKLLPLWPCNKPLWVLEQEIDAEQGLVDAILTLIKT